MYKVIKHPLIEDKLSIIRNVETNTFTFCKNVEEISQLMLYEATKNFELVDTIVQTPICKTKCQKLEKPINIIPILRAGLGMSSSIQKLITNANVGHIGLYRNDEEKTITEYYEKLPLDIHNAQVLLLDPMLATGGSLDTAIKVVKKHNPVSITYIGILASPEGLKFIQEKHPDVDIYVAALDEKLNEDRFIVPGLGDAGDRIFGTK